MRENFTEKDLIEQGYEYVGEISPKGTKLYSMTSPMDKSTLLVHRVMDDGLSLSDRPEFYQKDIIAALSEAVIR